MEASQGAEAYHLDFKQRENKLGSGTFADVLKIFRKYDNKSFAAKVLKISLDEMLRYEKLGFERELKILKSIDHPLIIQHVDEFVYNDKLCIISDFASEGDFEKVI